MRLRISFGSKGLNHGKRLSLGTFAGVGALLLSVGTAARADVIEYTSRTLFNSNTSGLTTLDFENLGTGSNSYTYFNGGLTDGGVHFADANNVLVTAGQDYGGGVYDFGTGVVLSAQGGYPSANSTMTVTLPAGTTAVGTDLGHVTPTTPPAMPDFVVTLSTGDTFDVVGGLSYGHSGSGFDFVGFTSTTPITSLTFTGYATTAYDNFSFGTEDVVSSTPEPGTVALLVSGSIAGIGFLKRRRTRR